MNETWGKTLLVNLKCSSISECQVYEQNWPNPMLILGVGVSTKVRKGTIATLRLLLWLICICFCGTAGPLSFLEAYIHFYSPNTHQHTYILLLLSHNMKNTLTYQHTVLASYELQRYNSRQETFLMGTEMISVIHLRSQHLPICWTV